MRKSEMLIYEILEGAGRMDVRPLAYSVDAAAELIFDRGVPVAALMITKDVYPAAAKLLHKGPRTVARSVDRLSRRCRDTGKAEQYIGWPIKRTGTKETVIDLAYYLRTGKPFFAYLREGGEDVDAVR